MKCQQNLETIIERIVDVAAPKRVILFGSAARGDSGHDSDVDEDALTVMSRIYGEMQGVGVAIDALGFHRRMLNATRTAIP